MHNSSLLHLIEKVSPTTQVAHAHCDVPCGVYEIDSMNWAVETCMKLVDKLLALQMPDPSNAQAMLEYQNTLIRAVVEKEEQAAICKKQVLILWTDYFKPEHAAKWPQLHELVWKTTKQCSTVKRTVSKEEVMKLHDMVHEVAEIFQMAKSK